MVKIYKVNHYRRVVPDPNNSIDNIVYDKRHYTFPADTGIFQIDNEDIKMRESSIFNGINYVEIRCKHPEKGIKKDVNSANTISLYISDFAHFDRNKSEFILSDSFLILEKERIYFSDLEVTKDGLFYNNRDVFEIGGVFHAIIEIK